MVLLNCFKRNIFSGDITYRYNEKNEVIVIKHYFLNLYTFHCEILSRYLR